MTENEHEFFTRCPHCTTMFRVMVQAVEASQGWVKCGRCHKVFDCREYEVETESFLDSGPGKANQQQDQEQDAKDPAPAPVESGVVIDPGQGDQSTVQPDLFSPQTRPGSTSPSPLPEEKTPLSEPETDGQTDREARPEPQISIPDVPGPAPEHAQSGLDHEPEKKDDTAQLVADNRRRQDSAKNKPASRSSSAKSRNPWLSKAIQSRAQSWKKEKFRFRPRKKYTAALLSVLLLAMLLWQVVIVQYARLSQYSFLSWPLEAVCSVFTCNDKTPASPAQIEFLYANLRRHHGIPDVISVSAKLMNYSNAEIPLPVIRLDLTDSADEIIASRLIDLEENPQYVRPHVSRLVQGQDVSLVLNIRNPDPAVQGFRLSLANPN